MKLRKEEEEEAQMQEEDAVIIKTEEAPKYDLNRKEKCIIH